MLGFIARRLLQMVPVLFIIATITFFMIRVAPGGPFDTERNTTPEIQKSLDRYYGFNLPIYRQYLRWLGNALHGDLGPDRKSTRLNSSHVSISYAVFCLKKKKTTNSHH